MWQFVFPQRWEQKEGEKEKEGERKKEGEKEEEERETRKQKLCVVNTVQMKKEEKNERIERERIEKEISIQGRDFTPYLLSPSFLSSFPFLPLSPKEERQ